MMTMMVIAITVQRCSFGLYSNSSESLYNPASKRRILVRASVDCDGDHSLVASPAERTYADFILIYFVLLRDFARALVLLPVSLIDIGRDCFAYWLLGLVACWLINHCTLFFCLQYWSDGFLVNNISGYYTIITCLCLGPLDTIKLVSSTIFSSLYTRDIS